MPSTEQAGGFPTTQWSVVLAAGSSSAVAKYPEAMSTRAWAMKTLNTQLASWTQLRHDTIPLRQTALHGSWRLRISEGLCRARSRVLESTTAQPFYRAIYREFQDFHLNHGAETFDALVAMKLRSGTTALMLAP